MKPRHIALVLALIVPASPAAESAGKMRGICWEGSRRIDASAVAPLAALGANWLSQTPFGWVPSLTSPEVRFGGDGGLWGETDEGLTATAVWARQLGIRTLLKPHLWVRHGEWQGDLAMADEQSWTRWFASYEAFILHYARLAEANGFEAFAVGTELGATTGRTADWKQLIARVRSVYHGKLTYCANWNGEPERIAFWSDLDFIGVQAYYPLAGSDRPTRRQIETAWEPIAAKLAALSKRIGKPVVFTEIGFKSHEGSLKEPWQWESSGAVDTGLQSDAFAATFATFWRKPWFGGIFVWKWHPVMRSDGRRDRDFTPQGKPALSVIRDYYKAR